MTHSLTSYPLVTAQPLHKRMALIRNRDACNKRTLPWRRGLPRQWPWAFTQFLLPA